MNAPRGELSSNIGADPGLILSGKVLGFPCQLLDKKRMIIVIEGEGEIDRRGRERKGFVR